MFVGYFTESPLHVGKVVEKLGKELTFLKMDMLQYRIPIFRKASSGEESGILTQEASAIISPALR
jgi:hypothetical protein